MATEENDTNKTAPDIWIPALAILCFAVLAYGIIFWQKEPTNVPFLGGECITYALMIWGIFYGLFLRGRGPKIVGIAFLAIWAALFIGGILAESKNYQQRSVLEPPKQCYASSVLDRSCQSIRKAIITSRPF
ncbi:MAG: hypothetical protein NTZ09_04535 [Candidatus Hydrogenedentes bacterium]|nr:hypothetical protein [Candidatus Hydrogenedentota bacterium]